MELGKAAEFLNQVSLNSQVFIYYYILEEDIEC